MSQSLEFVVDRYVCTDATLQSIVRGRKGLSSAPILNAILLLHDFIHGTQSANGAFLAAKRVDIRGTDAQLCILFLSSWAEAAFIQSAAIPERRAAAWTLLHRAKALADDSTPREIAARIALVEAMLVGADGDRQAQEQLLKRTAAALPRESPRRKFVVLELASLLAGAGRLTSIQKELDWLPSQFTENFPRTWLDTERFVDDVESGRLSLAADLISLLASANLDQARTERFLRHRTLLELMEASRDHPILPDAKADLPDWALALHCLAAGSVHQALRWARVCEKNRPVTITGDGCSSFTLLRAELAEGNAEAASRLLEMRRSKGNLHYLDDFFLARIAFLQGRVDEATSRFTAMMQTIDTFDAKGRLDFELRLASELPRDAVLNLTRTAEAIRGHLPPQTPAPVDAAREETSARTGVRRIVGRSQDLTSLRETITQLAPLDVPVLITGETGTGKELVAQALHESGPRATEPFVAINCGAISDSLLESELFGHEKGAFSGASTAHHGLFEEAGDGTIFLDEIGEISQRLQVVLLRVLETREIRPVGSTRSRPIACRILASTNADLQELARNERFRTDLIFRLRRLEIHLSPLRERREDITTLASWFLNLDRGGDVKAMISKQLLSALRRHPWPGNVRELRNAIERMRLMNSDKLYYELPDLELRAAQGSPDEGGLSPAAATTLPRSEERFDTADRRQPVPAGLPEQPAFRPGRSRMRRLATLRQLFRTHQMLTRSEIIATLQVAPNTATQDLKILCEEGFIERIQPSASPRSTYFMLKLEADSQETVGNI